MWLVLNSFVGPMALDNSCLKPWFNAKRILIGLTDDPNDQSAIAIYLMWLATHMSVPRTCCTGGYATGRESAVFVLRWHYQLRIPWLPCVSGACSTCQPLTALTLHNIKLKIMLTILNVYECLFCILIHCSIICLGGKWDICTLEAVAP